MLFPSSRRWLACFCSRCCSESHFPSLLKRSLKLTGRTPREKSSLIVMQKHSPLPFLVMYVLFLRLWLSWCFSLLPYLPICLSIDWSLGFICTCATVRLLQYLKILNWQHYKQWMGRVSGSATGAKSTDSINVPPSIKCSYASYQVAGVFALQGNTRKARQD